MASNTQFGTGEFRLEAMHEARFPGGVIVDHTPITAGEEITVLYNGLLSKSANRVYLHLGYGSSENWHDVTDLKMSRTGWGWVKTLEVKESDRLNFCFRDDAYNWDNNNGVNWSFEIHSGKLY